AAAMHCSPATASAILNGHRFPSWEQTRAIVQACNGEESEWRRKWVQADREITGAPPRGELAVQDSGVLRHAWSLDNEQVARNAAERVGTALSRILVSDLGPRRPELYTREAAARYFAAVLYWARCPGARPVRRITGVSNRV